MKHITLIAVLVFVSWVIFATKPEIKGYWAYLDNQAKDLGIETWNYPCPSVYIVHHARTELTEDVCKNKSRTL